MGTTKKKSKDNDKPKLDSVSLSTWARLRLAGKGPDAGKPLGAEVSKTKKKNKDVEK